MVVRLNRNTRTTTGEYFVRIIKEDSEGKVYSDERKYPVKIENNKIIPLKPIDDEKLKKKLKNLNSLYNMGILKNWKTIKTVK